MEPLFFTQQNPIRANRLLWLVPSYLHQTKRVCLLLLIINCFLSTQALGQDRMIQFSTYPAQQQNALFQRANTQIRSGHYDSAIKLLQQLLYINSIPGQKTTLLPAIYNHLGGAYIFKGQFDKAINYLQKGIMASKQDSDSGSTMLIKIYNNLSIVYNRIAENEQALAYLEKAEKIAYQYHHHDIVAAVLVNKGRIYKEMHQWKQSRKQFERALGFLDSIKNMEGVYGMSVSEFRQVALTNMGYLLLQQNKPHSALNYFDQALKLLTAKDNPYNSVPTLLGLGKTYLNLKDYTRAEQYLLRAYVLSTQNKVGDGITESMEKLSQLYAEKGDFKQAYRFHLGYVAMNTEIRGSDKIKEIKNLETRYKVAEKDKQLAEHKLRIAEQQKDIAQKNLWISGITIGGCAILLSGFMAYRNLKHRQRSQLSAIQLLQQEKEIDLLKALMQGEEKERKRIAHDLHDGIGGMLAAMKMNFAALKTRYDAQYNLTDLEPLLRMLEDTSDEVRKTAHNLMPSILLKHNLKEALTGYCDQISSSGRLYIRFYARQLPESLPKDFELMVYRTVQELIQNIIKHADASEAVVELEHREKKFNITVEDNGKGFRTDQLDIKGFGLQNIQFKVQALQGTILIESFPGKGTTISISFDEEHVLQSFVRQKT